MVRISFMKHPPLSFADLATSDCRYDETRRLLGYWQGLFEQASDARNEATPPEFDPVDIPTLLPYIYLLERDGDRLYYRISGENVNGLFERQLKGRYFDDVVPKAPYDVVSPYFQAVFDMKATLFKGKIILRKKEFMEFERLMVPVMRNDRIMLLGCAAFSTTATVSSNPPPESQPGFHFLSMDLHTGDSTRNSVDLTPVYA